MNNAGIVIAKAGNVLAMAGLICFLGIFAIVIVNGSWPDFLEPVRSRYELASNLVGGFAFIVEGAFFVGPGLLLAWFGESIKKRASSGR